MRIKCEEDTNVGMNDVTKAWQCDECSKWHDYEDDAINYCAPHINDGWKCKACGEYYLDEDEAAECCLVSYTCPECEATFKTIEAAENCCGCEIVLDHIPPAQLEAFGQQRLPL